MSIRPKTAMTVLALSAASLTLLSACGSSAAQTNEAAGKDTIVFAAIPAENSQSVRSQYSNIITLIEQETGKKVDFQDATDYAAVIEGQRAGKIDLAGYGPFSYVIAKDSGVPIEAIASMAKTADTAPGYTSTAWVPADSEITDLAGFKGKNICFVDKASTSGFLFPSAGLIEAGLDPETDVTQVLAGAHDASILSVAGGQCDGGFAQESMVPDLIEKGQLQEGQLKKVWNSSTIPGSPVAMNTETLDVETQDKVRVAIQEHGNVDYLVESGICSDAGTCAMPEKKGYFVKVDDAFYDPIRAVCDSTKADACKSVE